MKALLVYSFVLAALVQNAFTAPVPAKRKSHPSRSRRTTHRKPPAVDPTIGDNVDGEELTIRRAAVAALGSTNGAVVVVDPSTGRVLSMVNQKLALQSGFIPCSTIKLVTALAALTEHVVDRDSFINVGRRATYNLITALAQSNNQYFSVLGAELGFDRVIQYARLLGLGEKAGLDIPGEQPGAIPSGPPKAGGMGLMTAFGEGFLMTPLELASLLSAIANGGTLYYLQYPRTQEEIEHFEPKVKRRLDLSESEFADVKDGMRGAVGWGTARRANVDPTEPIYGKTGTCTDFRIANHMGWFGSFIDSGPRQLVVVVMLMSPVKSVSGPIAAGVAGAIYRNLSEQRYFASNSQKKDLPEILTTYPCCRQ